MNRHRQHRKHKQPPGTTAPCIVTVCRGGGDCANPVKHPDTDHAGQLANLRAVLPTVRVSNCLDTCERSNVVIITPAGPARRQGALPVWLGEVLTDDAIDDIIAWVRAGGPGHADPPTLLDLLTFHPSRRVRQAAET